MAALGWMPSSWIKSCVRCVSLTSASNILGRNSGQRWITRTKENPWWWKAADTIW
jgi:hypothetical protein